MKIGVNEDGNPITSCIVQPEPLPAPVPKLPKAGSFKRRALDAVRDTGLSADGWAPVTAVIEAVVASMVQPDKGERDTRKQRAKRELESLASEGLINIEGEKCRAS